MSTMTNELRMIEGKVIEISKLQELFTEKVLHQVSGFVILGKVLQLHCYIRMLNM